MTTGAISIRFAPVAVLLTFLLVSSSVSGGTCEETAQETCSEDTTDELNPYPWQVHYPSEKTALMLSWVPTLSGTLVGGLFVGLSVTPTLQEHFIGLFSFGTALAGMSLVAGPSIGHFYAHDNLWGLGGTGLRFIATGLAAAGGFLSYLSEWCGGEFNAPCPGMLPSGLSLAVIGSAALAFLTAFDIATAPRAVRRLKQQLPAPVPRIVIGAGVAAPGIGPALWGRF